MTERINPPLPLEGVDCPRCQGFGWVLVVLARVAPHKPETVKQICPMCHGTGEPQDGHMDEGCVPVGSDYGPVRGIQPPTKDLKRTQ